MDSLDSLEDALAPLLAKPLADTLGKLDVLDRAKLQTTLAYVAQDLIFMYLKTRGIDPATHPVMGQMTEISKYFNKIKEAEDPAKRTFTLPYLASPPLTPVLTPQPSLHGAGKFAVDKGAAKRFIDAALSDALSSVAPADRELAPTSATDVNQKGGLEAHLKKTEKMIERERLEEEESSEEDGDLEMFDGEEKSKLSKTEGAVPKPPSPPLEVGVAKRKRAVIDPFQGYEGPAPVEPSKSAGRSTPDQKGNKKKRKKDKAS
ncbi:hypothetical protein FRB90_003105 [Tulasnella sp. 427]|nr:hypothetical protein FRB90_003105 [Tulasnella sp. 427]